MRKTINTLTTIVIIVLAFAAGLLLAPGHSSASGTETFTRGCVIRFDGGPHIYDETNHACNAVQSLSVTISGDLLLNLTGLPAGSKILYMAAEEDETLSAKVQCGPSGGIGTTLVKCFSRSGNHVNVTGPLMNQPYANLWMEWVYEVPM